MCKNVYVSYVQNSIGSGKANGTYKEQNLHSLFSFMLSKMNYILLKLTQDKRAVCVHSSR